MKNSLKSNNNHTLKYAHANNYIITQKDQAKENIKDISGRVLVKIQLISNSISYWLQTLNSFKPWALYSSEINEIKNLKRN